MRGDNSFRGGERDGEMERGRYKQRDTDRDRQTDR